MMPQNNNPPIFDMDFEIDFDLSDFQLIDRLTEDIGHAPNPQQRVLQPRIDPGDFIHHVMFNNAEEFADQIDLSPHVRTFAWINGNFIFGDIIEALMVRRNMGVKKLHIASLGISRENIDSLKNCMIMMGDDLEKLVLVLSGYYYSHYKFSDVPYLYQELDDPLNRVQIAFGGYHAKIIAIETMLGNHLTIHGSANMRSSNSIEQIMVEQSDDLYAFNVAIMDEIADTFGTINHTAQYVQPSKKEQWNTIRRGVKKYGVRKRKRRPQQ